MVTRAARRRSRTPRRRSGRGGRHRTADVRLVEVEVPIETGGHWTHDVTTRWNVGMRFRVCRPLTGPSDRMLQVVELTGAPGDLGLIERFLRHHDGVDALTVLAQSPSRRYLRVVGPMPEACRRVFDSGALCASCRFLATETGSDGRWSLVVPQSPRLIRALARPEAPGNRRSDGLLRMRRFVPPRTLTPRQAATIEAAFRLGFYDFPRRTNLQEIARILHVSRATALEHLRRAEAKMLGAELSAGSRRSTLPLVPARG